MARCLFFWSVLTVLFFAKCSEPEPLTWPEVTQQQKPWTRWWWLGNILDKDELTRAMEAYKKAGVGGLEITPIYGVQGYEDHFIDYLSEEWMDKFAHVLKEAERLDLGIDMATGSGWPFGGPWISQDDACKYVAFESYELKEGEKLSEPVRFIQAPVVRLETIGRRLDISFFREPVHENENLQWLAFDQLRFEKPLPLHALMAYSDQGEVVDLTEKVDADGWLQWVAPEGEWKLYALFQGWHGKMVERASPGAEGNVIDHFSRTAILDYLKKFDNAFEGHDLRSLRSFFNDSYEVHDSFGEDNWTPEFLDEFKARRGYNLLHHLPALFRDDTTNKADVRVISDFRETFSDLLHDHFTLQWKQWAHTKGAIVRNQAHGAPANILDLYAASDIPETEAKDILFYKIASSASNITGKPLTSAEAFTWHDEHFITTLNELKKSADNYFLGGVNHIVYHGTTYSPQNEPWPGWMFYAAVHFSETNTWWEHLPAYNDYIARCQSFLQQGSYKNDVLLYLPYYDFLAQPGASILPAFRQIPNRQIADWLYKKGYSFDYVSDRQIQSLESLGESISTPGGGKYKTLLIPDCEYIPLETFEKLYQLAEQGTTIISYKNLPAEVPGFMEWEKRQLTYEGLKEQLDFNELPTTGVKQALVERGRFLKGGELAELLLAAGVLREEMVDVGLSFVKKEVIDGNIYFIVNAQDTSKVTTWISLQEGVQSVAIFDPMTGHSGMAKTRKGATGLEVFVSLEPRRSLILKTLSKHVNNGNEFAFYKSAGTGIKLDNWKLSFIEGGPELPPDRHVDSLFSWTSFDGETYQRFSGTASYTTVFNKPPENDQGFLLDLGRVAESAIVTLNGKRLGIYFSEPFEIFIASSLIKEENTLEIVVANLMANRVIYLDQQEVPWKKFYNINFPSRWGHNRKDGLFNASHWAPLESGLLGPVTLYPAIAVE